MLFAKVQYQVPILGLDNSGKTTLLEQLRHRHLGTPGPRDLRLPSTVGLNIVEVDIERVHMVFLDSGGRVGLRVLWDKFLTEAHALIYVIDSTDRVRLRESISELEKLLSNLGNIPLLVFCNKQDSEGAMQGYEMESEVREQCPHVTTGTQMRVQEICALTGGDIDKGLEWLLNAIQSGPPNRQIESHRPF